MSIVSTNLFQLAKINNKDWSGSTIGTIVAAISAVVSNLGSFHFRNTDYD